MDKVKVVKPREVFVRMLNTLEEDRGDTYGDYLYDWHKLRGWMRNSPDGKTRGFLVHPFELEFLLEKIADFLNTEK